MMKVAKEITTCVECEGVMYISVTLKDTEGTSGNLGVGISV